MSAASILDSWGVRPHWM